MKTFLSRTVTFFFFCRSSEILMNKKLFTKQKIEKLTKENDLSLKVESKTEHRSEANCGIFHHIFIDHHQQQYRG